MKAAADFLIQHTNERIVILNPDFSILKANEAYLTAVGKSKEEVIGAHCYEIAHGLKVPCASSQPDLSCPMVESMRSGESAHVIHEHLTSDGQFTFCDMVTYPIKNHDGDIVQVIEIWRDITEELTSRWEKRVKALKADMKTLVQEDRMISLGKLVASSVHEINNPIQGLLTFSHLMQDILEKGEPAKEELDDFKNYVSLMSKELERCGNIVSGLLSFSRESPMEYKDVDINEILESVVSLTRHKMELQAIDLRTVLSPMPLIVHGDTNQLQQCLLNFVFNAMEAMPQGGRLSVISEKCGDGKNGRIKIQDSGFGMSKEVMDHVFDPFFTTKEEGQGTGLGLSIAYGIIKNHKGNIKVNSEPGKGSTFEMNFVLQPLSLKVEAEHE
jgi:PAS domain S-box-containing protein